MIILLLIDRYKFGYTERIASCVPKDLINRQFGRLPNLAENPEKPRMTICRERHLAKGLAAGFIFAKRNYRRPGKGYNKKTNRFDDECFIEIHTTVITK